MNVGQAAWRAPHGFRFRGERWKWSAERHGSDLLWIHDKLKAVALLADPCHRPNWDCPAWPVRLDSARTPDRGEPGAWSARATILRPDEPGKGCREDRPIARHGAGRGHDAALLGLRPRSAQLPQDPADPAPLVRARAVGWGRATSDPQVVPALVARLDDEDPVVRLAANEELRKRTGRDFGFVAWASAEERAAAIARWRSWLTAPPMPAGPIKAPQLPPAAGGDVHRPAAPGRPGARRGKAQARRRRRRPARSADHGECPVMSATSKPPRPRRPCSGRWAGSGGRSSR